MIKLSSFRVVVVALLLTLAPQIIAQVREDEMAVGPNIEKADFFRAGLAPVHDRGKSDVTIVYFMDYQCPSCRRYTPDVERVLAEDKKVRLIYRDTPILSPLSKVAARVAIAASFQGRHDAIHHALMTTKGQLSEAAIRAAADAARVDWARLQRDLASRGEAIDRQIDRNLELSAAAGVSGTPGFIVGDSLADGALDYPALKAEIADARGAVEKGRGPVVVGASKAARDEAARKAPAEPTATKTPATLAPPLFRPSEPRAASGVEQPAASAASQSQAEGSRWRRAWIALAALVAVTGGGWWVVRRRRTPRNA